MAEYRIDILGELARQMAFTPLEARAAQLASAEELLHSLDAAKAYPFDFIVFRITGYRPREVSENLLTGIALRHDLGLLIEAVSATLDQHTSAVTEPVLQIEDVCERFNVTSKTIQRWRRKGLPARRFVFGDGKRRVGFLVSSVERFFAAHHDQVAHGANFSLITDGERLEIVRQSLRLATRCGCCEHEITRRVGRMFSRSPATILHTLRKHDVDHPHQAVLVLAKPALSAESRVRAARLYRRGVPLRGVARRMRCSRLAVYRVVMDSRMEKVNQRKVRFIDDTLYHQPDASEIMAELSRQDDLTSATRPEELRVPRDLPPYLAELYRTALLSPTRERALFLKLNFHKFQFVTARRKLEPDHARSRDLDRLESCLGQAVNIKNQIVRANLRLVVSVARKHLRTGLALMELISDGNITLMRAVEGFDLHRGYRFSTYATLALMKGFARSVPQMLNARTAGGVALLDALADDRILTDAKRLVDRDQVHCLLTRLDDRERAVLLAHYGIGASAAPATFEEVGARLGLSKQRVRQIEKSAIAKLRGAAFAAG